MVALHTPLDLTDEAFSLLVKADIERPDDELVESVAVVLASIVQRFKAIKREATACADIGDALLRQVGGGSGI